MSCAWTGAIIGLRISAPTIGNPICCRQRLMLSTSLPPSPGNVTTEMSAFSPFFSTAKLAKRIGEAGAVVQPCGRSHLISDFSEFEFGAAGAEGIVVLVVADVPAREARTHLI